MYCSRNMVDILRSILALVINGTTYYYTNLQLRQLQV